MGCPVPGIILIGERKSCRITGKNLVNSKEVLPRAVDILSPTRTLLSRLTLLLRSLGGTP